MPLLLVSLSLKPLCFHQPCYLLCILHTPFFFTLFRCCMPHPPPAFAGVDHQALVGMLKSLSSSEFLVLEFLSKRRITLSAEGLDIVQNGSPEAQVLAAIPKEGITVAALNEKLGAVAKIGVGKGLNKLYRVDKVDGVPTLLRLVDSMDDAVRTMCITIQEGKGAQLSDADIKLLASRKLATATDYKSIRAVKGPKFAAVRVKPQTDVTSAMLASGQWATSEFKEYNFNALGEPPEGGSLHPLMKVRTQYREIFLQMGFEEMPTNTFVESSFWNFDALFQPQAHPARDMHDTFFILDPATCRDIPADYMERVKDVHEHGGYGSAGYRYDWKESEARKNLLRTHTTAWSTRMLYRLAQQPTFTPKKYFSIDRVFRNETLDATHLAEFHQIEGLIADYNLTLADLIGVINQFFQNLGIKSIRFKPTYNPYTEPSMEIFSYHEGLKKWVEIGNSGVFRPEMLRPMGLPAGVNVIAWGLSLERPTMILYGYDNIRSLIGHSIKLSMMRDNPICRLDTPKSE
eukprot:TRINITY_DN5089_c0_g1_i3.p1 TRINITY_DN5089_c0_g1~~TRINITY_DN5089_c0_g1_i3.p1  ORF type:complete len:517 (-),score=121.31 TRINITY_DN5089_c0_g1_i3:27-1577(-)